MFLYNLPYLISFLLTYFLISLLSPVVKLFGQFNGASRKGCSLFAKSYQDSIADNINLRLQ